MKSFLPKKRIAAALISVGTLLATTAPSAAQFESGWLASWPGARASIPYDRQVQRTRRVSSYPKLIDAPKNDQKPQGQLLILVSLEQQRLKIYDERGLFAESPISSGTKDHPTPFGVFSIIEKSKWHRSNLYSSAPMPFMQRITWSGVALHAGELPGYPASHGCIRLPAQFASRLWNWSKLGARVIITPNEASVTDVSHKWLPTAAPTLASAAPGDRIRTADASGSMPAAVQTDVKPSASSAAELVSAADSAGDVKAAEKAKETGTLVLPVKPGEPAVTATEPTAQLPEQPVWMQMPKRHGQLAAFISRKDSRLYVRQNFQPVFDVPVTIKDDAPLGTHVFTARKADGDAGVVWSVTSLPGVTKTLVTRKPGKTPSGKMRMKDVFTSTFGPVPASPIAALDRIEIPDDALQRIAYHLSPGSSLVISDLSLSVGGETGRGTEFIVPLR